MQYTDWKYDFPSLPRWDMHSIPYAYDSFYELPKADMLCCIYSIVEVTMCNYLGVLAILKNKQAPTLFLNITDKMLFRDNVFVNADENLIFLTASIYNADRNLHAEPIVVIDIEKNRFSYFKTSNLNPSYKIVELKKDVFGIEADAHQTKHDKRLRALTGKQIKLGKLTWYGLDSVQTLPEMLFKKSIFF